MNALFASQAPEDSNLLVLGSTRVNGILAELQEHPPALRFWLRTFDVVKVNKQGKPEGDPIEEERSEKMTTVPVVVSRREGTRLGWVTMIASNHGRAVHRVGEILTTEPRLRELFQDTKLLPWSEALPRQFQILLKIQIFEGEGAAGKCFVEDIWAPADSSSEG